MSVVQRCPNCGTTQVSGGECEACHEAQVRYFCTNHEPGIWLDGPRCPQCEARAAAPAPTPARASRVRSPARAADVGALPRDIERPRRVDEETLEVPPSPEPLWAKLLRGGVLARRAPPTAELEPAREPLSLGQAGGWLVRVAFRLLIVAVVLVVAVVGALYWLARAM